jgi:hypothetical protein
MNGRARVLAAFCAIGLACGVLVVWRHEALTLRTARESRALRRPSELFDSVPLATPAHPATAVAAPAQASPGPGLVEEELMRLLRTSQGNDSALAIELAREGNRRFAGSPDAPERASILIHALAEEGLSSEARGEAEDMVNRYPDSAWVREVEQFTGARRHRNIQVGPDGELRYVDPVPPTRG